MEYDRYIVLRYFTEVYEGSQKKLTLQLVQCQVLFALQLNNKTRTMRYSLCTIRVQPLPYTIGSHSAPY